MSLAQEPASTLPQWLAEIDLPPLSLKRPASPDGRQDTPYKRFRCDPCGTGFTTKRALLRHNRENQQHGRDLATEQHHCVYCTTVFARSHDRDRHQREQHGNGKAACSACGKHIRRNAPHKNPRGDDCSPRADSGIVLEDTDPSLPIIDGLESGDPDDISARMRALNLDKPLPKCVLKNPRQPTRTKEVSCGICHHAFESLDPDKLSEHLNQHFADLSTSKWRCDACQINFVHGADLVSHLQSAAKGDCGFKFTHRAACSGHHPPSRSPLRPPREDDGDRFDFSYRLQHWEQAQLRAFISSVRSLANIGVGERCTISGCVGCPNCSAYKGIFKALRPLEAGDRAANTVRDAVSDVIRCVGQSPRHYNLRPTPSSEAFSPSQRYMGEYQDISLSLQSALDDFLAAPGDIEMWNSILVRAAASGDLTLAIAARENGACPDAKDPNGRTALQHACIGGAQGVVHFLLDNGADPQLTRNGSSSAVYLALRSRKKDAISHGGSSGVDIACIGRLLGFVGSISRANRQLPEVLCQAVANEDDEVVTFLLQRGANPNHRENNALECAASSGNVRIAQVLIDSGAVVISTHLLRAVHCADIGMVEFLVHNGADVDSRDVTGAALSSACELQRWDVARFLLSRQASVDDTSPRFDHHPLKYAAEHGNLDMVRHLLERCTDLNVRDNIRSSTLGAEALFVALWFDHRKVAEVICERNIAVADSIIGGHSMLCAVAGLHSLHETMPVRFLVARGAGISTKCSAGNHTALGAAIDGKRLRTVRCLLALGVDPSTPCKDGHSPLCLVEEADSVEYLTFWERKAVREIRQVLLDAGAMEGSCGASHSQRAGVQSTFYMRVPMTPLLPYSSSAV